MAQKLKAGDVVKGRVVIVGTSGIVVHLDKSYTGTVELVDLTNDYTKVPSDIVKVDDVLEFVVISVKDNSGTVQLRLKALTENEEQQEMIDKLKEEMMQEICDVVIEEVTARVQQKLSEMKSELINEIAGEAAEIALSAIMSDINSERRSIIRELEQQNAELNKLIDQLKTNSEGSAASVPFTAPAKSSKSAKKPTTAASGISKLSPKEVENILSYPDYYRKFCNWIIYIKRLSEKKSSFIGRREYYGELYKVRTNGKDNQKIYKGKVSSSKVDAELYFKIKRKRVHFKDIDGNERVVDINIGENDYDY